MTNDSVAAALMLNYQIANLASLDSDLTRVPGLTLYQPTDISS
jgi:predicted nucleic acid-binding protein